MFSCLLEQMMLFCAVMFESEHVHILCQSYRDVRQVLYIIPLRCEIDVPCAQFDIVPSLVRKKA